MRTPAPQRNDVLRPSEVERLNRDLDPMLADDFVARVRKCVARSIQSPVYDRDCVAYNFPVSNDASR